MLGILLCKLGFHDWRIYLHEKGETGEGSWESWRHICLRCLKM